MNGVYWTDDGSYQNSVSGENVGGGEGWGASLTAVYTPTDKLKFKTRVEYSDDKFDPQPIVRLTHDTPLPYPEDAYLVGLTGGTSRDRVNSDEGNVASGQGASTESTAILTLRDHGLYCGDVLDDPTLTADQREERQRALMQMFPDYPRVDPNFVADNYTPDPGVAQPAIPLSLRQIDDGTGNLVQPLVPGWCNARSFGDADGKQVTHSENPLTGTEYEGTEAETWRASLLTTWDEDFGTFSLNMGFTDAYSSIDQDQDYQASGRPDIFLSGQGAKSGPKPSRPASNCVSRRTGKTHRSNSQSAGFTGTRSGGSTTRTSSPAAWTPVGWRTISSRTSRACVTATMADPARRWTAGRPTGNSSSRTRVRTGQADTEHTSIYAMFEFEVAENWKLTLEDRYVDEDFNLSKPNQSSCTNLAFSIGAGAIAHVGPWLDEALNPGFDARCTSQQFDFSTGPIFFRDLPQNTQALYLDAVIAEPGDTQQDLLDKLLAKHGGVRSMPGDPLIAQPGDPLFNVNCQPLAVDANCAPWGNIIGSTNSKYHVPKVTMEWMPTDDVMLYGFWARGQKPGGINQISAGGSATTIEQERFDPEVMDTYELGWKTTWEAGGFLLFNGAVFFLDYTDKQVGTQILVPDGQGGFRSSPRVINASSAEVWGLELETTWQPEFMEGLVLSGSYTYLDTQYTDFVDETTTFYRAAQVGNCPVVWKDRNANTIATGVTDPNLDDNLYPVADRTYDVTTGDLNPIFAPKCALDLSGHALERSPKNAFVGNVSLTRPFLSTDYDWFTQLNAIYQDERFQNADNFLRYEDYWLFDFQLGLSSDNLDVLLYVDNVFDDDTLKSGGEGPDFGAGIRDRGFPAGLVQLHSFGALPDPRQVGVRLNYRFQ